MSRIDDKVHNVLFNTKQPTQEIVDRMLNISRVISLIKNHDKLSKRDLIKVIQEFLFTFNYVYKLLGLLTMIDNKYIVWDTYMEVAKINFLTQTINILESLHVMYTEQQSDNNNTNIIHRHVQRLLFEFSKSYYFGPLTDDVYNQLDQTNTIDNTGQIETETLSEYISNLPQSITINRDTYYYFQKRIRKPHLRQQIEEVYYSTTNRCLDSFTKLVNSRHEYATKLGYSNYFSLVKRSKNEDVETLISSLCDRLVDKVNNELAYVRNVLAKKKIKTLSHSDVIYYREKSQPKKVFNLSDVITVLFYLSQTYMGLTFVEYHNPIWNDCKCYQVYLDGTILGIFYLDLYMVNHSPTCITLMDKYTDVCDNTYNRCVVLLAGYQNKAQLTHQDIITLAREFGHSIQVLTGKVDEFYTIIANVFEYFMYDYDILKHLNCNEQECKEYNDYRQKFIGYNLKMRCINSLFDYRLHINSTNDVYQMYKSIYSKIMKPHNLKFYGINPSIIYQELNGIEGRVYEGLASMILGYGLYTKVKLNKNGNELIQIMLNGNIRKQLNRFVKPINSYEEFVVNVVGY